MTVDEYRLALESLTPNQRRIFRSRIGGPEGKTIDEDLIDFLWPGVGPQGDLQHWEQVAVFALRGAGVDVRTESEKLAIAARELVTAAVASAEAAQASAQIAREAIRDAWIPVLISWLSLGALIMTIVVEAKC